MVYDTKFFIVYHYMRKKKQSHFKTCERISVELETICLSSLSDILNTSIPFAIYINIQCLPSPITTWSLQNSNDYLREKKNSTMLLSRYKQKFINIISCYLLLTPT